jgi:hypothetical protein
LGSAEIGHVILEGEFKDLVQEFLPVFHVPLLVDRINFNALSNHDINLPGDPIEWVNRLKKSYRNKREIERNYFEGLFPIEREISAHFPPAQVFPAGAEGLAGARGAHPAHGRTS